MATYVMGENGKLVKEGSKKKKKKKSGSVTYVMGENGVLKPEDEDIAPVKTTVSADDDDIAPVKRAEADSKLDFLQKSLAFDDGYQLGDVTKTILGTLGDAGLEVVKGAGSLVEGVTDAVQYGVAGITDVLGADAFAERTRKRAMENRIEQWTENLDNRFEQNSVLGRTADSILQGVGQVGGIMATGGIAGAAAGGAAAGSAAAAAATTATTGLMAVSGFGSGAGEAYKAGATDGEAMTYGLISGAADALTELLFGGLGKAVGAVGLSKGLSAADDMLATKVSGLFTNQIAKNFAEFGIKAGAEGFEEVLAGTAQAIGKKITYMQDEELSEILKDENLLEQFVVGATTSGMIQSGLLPGTRSGSLIETSKEGRDFISGYNQIEQSVIDKEVEKRVAAQEKGGKKLTKKEIGAIEKMVQEDLDKGGIDIDTIEEVLGGETYSNYKKLVDAEDKMQAEYDALGKKAPYTMEDTERRKELADRLKYVREKGARNELRKRLDEQVSGMVKGSRLSESFAERSRRGQKFEADLKKYVSPKQREIVKKAIDSGILNNTRRTHEFVDMVARIAADKDVSFDFTNNAKLKESGFAVDGKFVNGYVTKDGITVNIQSSKSLNSVVGHEIAHVLEGTELYAEMQQAVFQYAETKKDLAERRGILKKLYDGVEGADIDAELTADLVGDYLFTDSDFINNLSANHRNVFQKIYDELKYLLKVATAGSKEARRLEQVKHAFDKAYRDGGKNKTAEDGGAKYHISSTFEGEIDQVLNGEMTGNGQVKARDYTPEILVQNGVKNLPMLITQNHVKTTIYTEEEAKSLGLPTGANINYHGLGKELLMKSIDSMDAPLEIYKKDDDHYIIITELQDASGRDIIIPVKIDGKGTYNDVYIDENQILSVYGKKNLQGYLARNNFQQIYTKKGTALNEGVQYSNISDSFDGSVAQEDADVKTQYSLSSDTEGRQLSTEQREYFKDSKIVDQNGNLKVMYHGSNAQFSVFDKSKAKSSGLYGKGFYFTDSSSHAGTYGSQYEVYLDIRNPLQDGAATITRSQVRRYLEAIAENEDYSIENYGTYDIDKVLDVVMGKNKSEDAFKVIQDINITAVGDMVEAAELFNLVNGTNFDGIVVPTETIAFRPEQIKRTDNAKPTADPDIRYSLSATVKYDGLNEADKASAQKVIRSLRTQEMGADYGLGSYGTYTQERMDREISASSSSTAMDYAKSYITWVKPDDFIYATTVSEQGRERIKEEAGTLDIERLRSETQPIHLTVDFETGQIVGHEGRHRMLALQEAGVEKVAVIIDAQNDDRQHTKPVDFMRLEGQRFSDYQKGVGFYLHDMLPLSKRYADTARDLFTTKPKKGVQFSLSEEIEPTDRLVAVHNKSVRGLQRMLDRNGVAFASIAIKKAGASHEGFGDVSIVFPRSTIDPEGNRWNKLYSNDAWTPTEPHTEYDVGDTYKYKKLFENMLGSDIYRALRGDSYLDSDSLERELGSSNGDVFEAVKRLGVVKYGYLQSIGQRPEMTTKQKSLDGFGRYKNDQLMAVFEALDGETIRSATYDSEEVLQQIADILNAQFEQQFAHDEGLLAKFKKKPLYEADDIRLHSIQDAYETWEAAGRTIPTEMDTYALENAMRDNRELEENEDYRRWVEATFDGLIKDSGIPNGRDYYTPSGNRRSFKQLHVPATLENIVQQMRKENETGIGSLGSINLRGAATKTYATVEEMRADSHKLLGTHIDDDVYDGYMDGFHARLNELKLKAAKGDSWSSRDTAEQVLLEAVRDAKTKASMASKLRKEAEWINYEPSLVDELWQLKQDVQNMPAPYFEAKPRRIITPDEAAAYIVPDNAPATLFAALNERGLKYVTYKAGDEADRLAKLNGVLDEQPDLRFSLSNEGDIAPVYGSYNVRGEDVALEGMEDIAPVRQDIAPETVAENATVQDAAASPYDELDQLGEQLEEMERQQEELLAAGEYEQAEALLMEIGPASARMSELQEQIKELEAQQAAEDQERLASFNDEDAPVPGEATHSEDTDTVTLPKSRRNTIAATARKALGFAQNRVSEMRELVDRFSQGEIDSEMLLDEIAERFGTLTEKGRDEEIAEVRSWLRTSPISVSDDVKSNFADYGSSVFRANRGRLRFSNNGPAVDQFYAEASSLFPGYFPADIINPADQLEQIIKVANYDINTEQTYELDDQMLQDVVDEIVKSVNEYRRSQRQAAADASIATANASLAQDSNVPAEEDIAPVRADVAADEDIAPVRADVAQETIGGQTIKTMQERLDAKVQHLQTELENTIRQREGAVSYYQRKMAEKKAEYDKRKNKNTKAAYANLRSVERYMRIGSSIDADYAKKISDLEGRVAKASEEARNGESKEVQGAMRKELQAAKVEEIRTELAADGFDLDTVLADAKDLSTWSTVDNTPERVNEKTFGYKAGQAINRVTIDRLRQHTTEGTRWLNTITGKGGLLAQLSKQYNIKPRSDESKAAQMYAEGYFVDGNGDKVAYGDRELAMDFPDAKVQANIKGLASDPRIRQFYDETLGKINESRTRNAYAAIKPLQNYFLHFRAMDDFFSKMGIPFNPNDIKAKDLPTDMNGVTADLKPGQPYFASSKHRRGIDTTFDLLGGLERYAKSAMPQIYYIDDIQMHRAFRNYIADSFGQAHGLEGLDTMTEEEAAAQIEKVYGAHLSNYARFLTEEANVIAGKTAMTDRAVEGIIGRRGLTALDTLNRQVGANMVGFNVSSSLTNFIAAVQAFAKTNKAAFMKGFAQTVANRIGAIYGKTDGFAENNPTMIRRKGADNFSRTPWQKISDIGYLMMGAVDSISTELIVRGKYNELIGKGVSEEQAVEWADKWTSRLMGDRSIGQQPQLYNSKTLGIFTKFQLEVRNQLDSMFYDTIQEAKLSNEDIQNAQARNAKTAAQVTATLATLAVTSHLFGKAFESVAGYNPAFDIIEAIIKAFGWDDEEDSEDTVLDNLGQGFMSLLEDMPYSSLVTDGGRIPISSALPLTQLIKGEDKYGNEKSRLETIAETVPYYLLPGGYGQLKKTKAGLAMFDEDLPIAGSYTDSGNLRFTVEDTFENRVQAAVFGQWASENAQEYFDNEYKPLQEKQIQELVDSGLPIREYRDYREGLKDLDTLGEKVAYIADLDLPIDTKNLLVNNIADREDPIDLTDFGEYDDWGEFEYAHKYPKKYDFLTANNISVAEYESFDEDTKAAWTWAYQNPEKFALSKTVTNDVVTYRQYAKELNDITGVKDASGKTISGSRKQKVANYLNNLSGVDYYAKLILFKMEYPSDDTYNRAIIEYLNSREDITFDDEVTILKELGFTVTADGTVRW